jgi:hypothetical protein
MNRKILIDGQEIHAERIEVIYDGVSIPNEEGTGSLHINLTHEGVVMDVWGNDTEEEEINFGTSSQTAEEITDYLCEENE